jgi:protein SCO1/2
MTKTHGRIPAPSRRAAAWLAAVVLLVCAAPVRAGDDIPDELKGIDITPKLGTQVPLDHHFRDERGRDIALSDFFGKDRPVVFVLAYYRCPMLCTLVLQATADGLKEIDWSAGDEYEVVVLSIDPGETPALAKLNHQKFVARYGRAGSGGGIHFLTGKQPDIKAVADAVGFHYRYDEKRKQYVHAAGIFILTPGGKLSQCITGVQFEPKTLRYSLLDASEGKQGSLLEKVLLWCHTYDPESGQYTLAAMNIMRIAGLIVLLAVVALVVPAWLRSRRGGDEKPNVE